MQEAATALRLAVRNDTVSASMLGLVALSYASVPTVLMTRLSYRKMI